MRWGGLFDYAGKKADVQEKEKISTSEGFWDDPKEAEAFLKKLSGVKYWVNSLDAVANALEELFPDGDWDGFDCPLED